MKESPIFTRTHDLLRWLLQATRKFPREQRFVLAQQLHQQAFAFQEALVTASLDHQRKADALIKADIRLTCLRKTLLLCVELEVLSAGQYKHVSEIVQEIGRLLGGWRRHK